jgi:hypothetical protein
MEGFFDQAFLNRILGGWDNPAFRQRRRPAGSGRPKTMSKKASTMLETAIAEFEAIKIRHETTCKKHPTTIRLLPPQDHLTGTAFSKLKRKVKESYQWSAFRMPATAEEKAKFGITKRHTFYWTCVRYRWDSAIVDHDCSCGLRASDGKSKGAPMELHHLEGKLGQLHQANVEIYRGREQGDRSKPKVPPSKGKLCKCGKYELFGRANDPTFTIKQLKEDMICQANGKDCFEESVEFTWVRLEQKIGEEISHVACV